MRTKVRHASPPSEERLTAKVRRLPAVHPGEVLSEDLMTPLGLSITDSRATFGCLSPELTRS